MEDPVLLVAVKQAVLAEQAAKEAEVHREVQEAQQILVNKIME
jgi:hypothetical protein